MILAVRALQKQNSKIIQVLLSISSLINYQQFRKNKLLQYFNLYHILNLNLISIQKWLKFYLQLELNSQIKQSLYYNKSDKYRNMLGKFVFDVRFQPLKSSFIFGNLFTKLWILFKYKFLHQNFAYPKNLNKLKQQLPILKPQFLSHKDKITYTWIGHSTAIISIDPVFAKRASPFQFIGPKRYRQPACKIQQLPQINCVLVSHDHYDHMDKHSLQKIYEYNRNCYFIGGLQSCDIMPNSSKKIELDWTQSVQLVINKSIFRITFIPVAHWGKRSLFDTNQRLWGGFVIETPRNKRIFYSGDTGYCPIFKELQQQYNSFDLSILPIGTYKPRHLLSPQHLNPQQAVLIHKQIKSKKSVGVHWGTFPLGNQHYLSPKVDLQAACRKYQIEQSQFLTIKHGQAFSIQY